MCQSRHQDHINIQHIFEITLKFITRILLFFDSIYTVISCICRTHCDDKVINNDTLMLLAIETDGLSPIFSIKMFIIKRNKMLSTQ